MPARLGLRAAMTSEAVRFKRLIFNAYSASSATSPIQCSNGPTAVFHDAQVQRYQLSETDERTVNRQPARDDKTRIVGVMSIHNNVGTKCETFTPQVSLEEAHGRAKLPACSCSCRHDSCKIRATSERRHSFNRSVPSKSTRPRLHAVAEGCAASYSSNGCGVAVREHKLLPDCR